MHGECIHAFGCQNYHYWFTILGSIFRLIAQIEQFNIGKLNSSEVLRGLINSLLET